MNRKGQSLVTFLVIIPVLILLLGSIVETSSIFYQKARITSVTKTIIKSTIDKKENNDIIMLYGKNSIDYTAIDIIDAEGLEIHLKAKIKGMILGKDYDAYISILGYLDDGKVKFKKGN